MSVEPHLIFLNSSTLSEPGTIDCLFQALEQANCEVQDITFSIQGVEQQKWERYHHQKAKRFQANSEPGSVKCVVSRASEIDQGIQLELLLNMVWGDRKLGGQDLSWISAVCFQSPLFRSWDKYDGKYYSHQFLEFGKVLFSVLSPEIGWLDYGDLGSFPWFDDLQSEKLPKIFWANYFGKRWVRRIGSDKLANAPGWKVDKLSDRGIIYVISPYLGEMSADSDELVQYWKA